MMVPLLRPPLGLLLILCRVAEVAEVVVAEAVVAEVAEEAEVVVAEVAEAEAMAEAEAADTAMERAMEEVVKAMELLVHVKTTMRIFGNHCRTRRNLG